MNRRIGLTALAVVLAVVGAAAVYVYAHGADKRAAESLKPTPALIVQKAIPAGTSWQDAVKGGYAAVQKVPASAAPSSAITSLTAAVPDDDVATFGISAGQILVREMFGRATPRTGALAIPNHLQALTVSLTTDADVGGFVQNGSNVAIYATFKTDGAPNAGSRTTAGGTDVYATKLLLRRVNVLAVDQVAPSNVTGAQHGSTNGPSDTSRSTDRVLVTLAVDQKSAERIVLAQQVGTLYLSLLTANSETVEDGGTINFGRFNPEPIFAGERQ